MKRMFVKALSLVCCIALMLAAFSACGSKKTVSKEKTDYNEGLTQNLSSGTVAENGRFRLDWDGETANVMITDKQTGYIYSQIPYDYYTANRANFVIEARNYSKDTPVPEAPVDYKYTGNFSPVNIDCLTISNNATTTMFSAIEVGKRGRVASEKTENGIRVTYYFDAQQISIPVDYTVSEDGFAVQVVPLDIVEGDIDNRILSVSLSPMLCSVKNSSGSYIVVPSGSGALMYTDVRTDNTVRTFRGEVYGTDPAVEYFEKLSNETKISMPVFGVVENGRAVCGIIEQGSEACVINAQAGDPESGYSAAYVTCYVRGYNKPVATILGGRIRIRTHIRDYITSSAPIKIAYHILSGDSASYAGIANYYSNYLVSQKGMSDTAKSKLLYTEIIGGYRSNELFLGIPYMKTKALTTYKQATEIVKTLAQLSDGSLTVNMVGFGTCGVDSGKVGGGFKLTGVYGGGGSLKSYLKACSDAGADTYFDYDIVQFTSSAAGLGDTAVTANNAAIKNYKINISTKLRMTDNFNYLLQRSELPNAAEKAQTVSEKYGIKNLSLGTLGSTAYSDYYTEDYYNKAKSEEDTIKIITDAKKNGSTVATSNANAYAAAVSDVVFDVPTKSNMNNSFDAEIPFYQMVFKGYVDFTVDCINTAADYKQQYLKAIECGSGISFAVTAETSLDAAIAGEDIFYATLFEDNKPHIENMINGAKKYLDSVSSAKITAHAVLSSSLTKTVFDNGVKVYVNFGDADVTVDGVTVSAESFKAFSEGGTVIE